jgi:ESS family glutamate:Na+ symporter
MEPLTLQITSILAVYLVVWGVLWGGSTLLAGKPQIASMLFGFHFVIAGIVAMLARRAVGWTRVPNRLHDGLLGRIAGTTVDVATTAAFCAIEIRVLSENVVPILVASTLAGLLTLVVCLWVGRRAFPSAPFEHALVLYGCSTGTMPTGLALLRVLDPELRGPVATSAVLGATAAIVLGAPLLLVVIPTAVAGWPQSWPGPVWAAIGLLVVYTVFLALLWRFAGSFRSLRPLTDLWPRS